ncbi:hypothetical protein CEXT_768381 [Caerostris extrusa]|uniref:Uncharacterized protein n=1 Tax=Caerostris extrusa TaxID=172846 RepID=A0AAV4TQX2_CAEEX|nr:hypothetical protein CEXT_768381 [Caerostris extrusa]
MRKGTKKTNTSEPFGSVCLSSPPTTPYQSKRHLCEFDAEECLPRPNKSGAPLPSALGTEVNSVYPKRFLGYKVPCVFLFCPHDFVNRIREQKEGSS